MSYAIVALLAFCAGYFTACLMRVSKENDK